ncbi:hypothetical protein, partial [Ruminococcus flavefaciens]|uniref:hypothetical protein n=1 Tax=Ruminococcus flavefaciens TaxID=1265 RepID=UPI002A912C28
DQQFQRRRSPTCGTKKFKATISSRFLIYAYFRFWVFYDCTFLDNSTERNCALIQSSANFVILY